MPRILLALLLLAITVAGVVHRGRHFIDYPVYELAASKVLAGHADGLYDLGRTTPGGFYYPYFFALAFTPFAAAGPVAGRWLFLALFLAAYGFVLAWSVRWFPNTHPVTLALVTGLLTLHPMNDALMNANIGLLLLALCLLAFRWRDSRPALAGLCLGAAIAFKLYPLLVLGWFVWARRYRVVAWTLAATAAFLCLVPVVANGPELGWRLVREQLAVTSHFGSHWPYDSIVFQNVPATMMRYARFLDVDPQLAFRSAMIGGPLLLVAFFARSFLSRKPRPPLYEARMFALVLAAVPMLVPVSWYNMALFYAPLLAWIADRALYRRDRAAAAAAAAYVALYCLTTSDLVGRPLNHRLEALAVPFFGVLAVIVAYVRTLAPAARRDEP